MGLRGNRDATDSWAGYLYQSVLGLIVALEKILELHDTNQPIEGHFTYEDVEDFSIYIKDSTGNVTASSTYQAKYKKGEARGIYYPFFRELHQARTKNNTGMRYFLNISMNIDFDEVNATDFDLPDDFISLLYVYQNGRRYLGGTESLSYLETLILSYCEKNNIERCAEKAEKISSRLLALIDSIIIETKEQRLTTPVYRREIEFQEIVNLIRDTRAELSEELISTVLRKRFNKALLMCSEPLDNEEAAKLDTVAKLIANMSDEAFLSFVKKMQMHKDLASDVELVSSFASVEELQEVLFAVIRSTSSQFDVQDVVFKKNLNAYRPSTLRMGRSGETNLKLEYLPKIKKNMSEFDIRGYFETKKIIIDGQTIEDIWGYEITSSDSPKAENKINEPELKTLVSVDDAIRELDEDE